MVLMMLGPSLMFGGFAGAIAASKGRPIWGSFLLGAFLWPVGLLVAATLPRVPDAGGERPARPEQRGARAVTYWALVAVLAMIGVLGVFTIGAPFLLLSGVLAALGPYRHRPSVFWPIVFAVPAFVGGFLLVTPLGCTSTSSGTGSGVPAVGRTACSNAIGIDYSGDESYQPSHLPALAAGMGAAVTTAAGVRLLAVRRERQARPPGIATDDSETHQPDGPSGVPSDV